MAEVLPVAFPIPGESAIASYNYTDVAEGTGVVEFYGAETYDTTATRKYILTANQITSNTADLISPNGTINFDLSPFNSPRTIKGTAYFSVGMYESSSAAYYITAKIQKSSGGVVTDCSAAFQSDTIQANGVWKMVLVAIPLTQTHFKKGDFLRLNLDVHGANNGNWSMGCDPTGRSGTYINSTLTAPSMTTKLTLNIPFKLDL